MFQRQFPFSRFEPCCIENYSGGLRGNRAVSERDSGSVFMAEHSIHAVFPCLFLMIIDCEFQIVSSYDRVIEA